MSQSSPQPNFDIPLGGRYEIISQLGAGGFGQTFLVQDLHLPGHPRCVVKKLLPQKNDTENLEMARRLFDTEAKVLYKLGSHDQIPRLLAHFEQHQEFYLAQEFVEGAPLSKELLEGQPWQQEQVLTLLQDILQILAFVHQQQVIHRDIKPANLIRRRKDDRIVLIDFGAVKQVSTQCVNSDTELTDMTISIGTQGFIPNEQLAGKPRYSSDVYAVGIIGIWALTGIHPKHLKDDPRTGEINWRDRATFASRELIDVLEQMVRYDFRDRYPTAIEALGALRSLPSDMIKSLPPPSPMPQPVLEVIHAERPYLPSTPDLIEVEPELEPTSLWLHNDSTTHTLTIAHATDSIAPTQPMMNGNGSAVQTVAAKVPQKRRFPIWRGLAVLAMGTGAAAAAIFALEPAGLRRAKEQPLNPVQTMASSLIGLFPEQEAIELMRNGNQLREAGQYQDALTAYDKALELRSDLAEAYWGRCSILNALEQPNEALVACNDALAIDPQYAEAIVGKGKALEQQRRYIEALRLYEYATAVNPQLADAWIAQGMALQTLERSAEALTALERGIGLNRESAEAWSARASALWNLRRYNEAIASLDKALQLDPNEPNARALRQKAREDLGR
ncbi:tetratricopeptide repeat protein [Oculatella sp. LEGE 06141]|uniref:serine/threonine-protein kinase n=1 Tax=Oculatella sp. LEGE 06141 TaxID=1828648 RepID=UPI001882FDEC|nr:serine/threonine-protein kinase [Oculatella sp. LEGE 06141]MBE9179215.1 tetratricopeptide repeat protein [Oculatella sp. LEGE 06141]